MTSTPSVLITRPPAAFGHPSNGAFIALAIVARVHGINVEPSELEHELGTGKAPTGEDLMRAAASIGLTVRRRGPPSELLREVRRPTLIADQAGNYAVLWPPQPDGSHPVQAIDPQGLQRPPQLMAASAITERWNGALYLIERAAPVDAEPVVFGFRWFLPSIWRLRAPLAQVLLASFFVQIFGLITPLCFQIVVDKVLVHKATATLTLVTLTLVLMGLFDVTLQYLRSYAQGHAASRLDVELGWKLLSHLLKLPLKYFENRPAGQTVARVRELENIRTFLTGPALTSSIDLLFTIVFFIVLSVYSVAMTGVLAAFIPLFLVTAALFRPLLRNKIQERFSRGAESQQFLVESVVGMHTLKALAVEPIVRWQWTERFAAYIKTAFQAVLVSAVAQNVMQYLSRLSTALLLFLGAQEVIEGRLTVGGLVAFNMLSAQVMAPVLRLSQLWQDFQQVQISVNRVGDIFNAPPEPSGGTVPQRGAMRGAVRLRDVHFRYDADTPEVLKGISLDIRAGEVLGIVGPSGSGKSTLAKLIQRLYVPTKGQVAIDGVDIATLRLPWLRSQMGVVLQENLLFNRTVRENILLSNPALSDERMMEISRLAGAHEFIMRMPLGYDAKIVERGANLSGGQRQRIAIARALARDPRVLIFDEATSALDYESERIIQENMRQIVRARTVLIIAHRLAAVRHCDRIIALEDGLILEEGSHRELLERKDGLYARLWKLQTTSGEA